jgi:hypothetical protein
MWTLFTSHAACLVYGAAIGWAATHWTAVRTAEATVAALFGKKVSEPLIPPAAPAAPSAHETAAQVKGPPAA